MAKSICHCLRLPRCCHCLRLYQHQIHYILIMPPKQSGTKKTNRVRPTTTSRSPSCSASEARSEHSQVAEPPEPVPETERQEMESTASPGPSDTSASKSETQMLEEYGEQRDPRRKPRPTLISPKSKRRPWLTGSRPMKSSTTRSWRATRTPKERLSCGRSNQRSWV